MKQYVDFFSNVTLGPLGLALLVGCGIFRAFDLGGGQNALLRKAGGVLFLVGIAFAADLHVFDDPVAWDGFGGSPSDRITSGIARA